MTIEEARALLVRRHLWLAARITPALDAADFDPRAGAVRQTIYAASEALELIERFDAAMRAAQAQAGRESAS